MTSDRFDDLVGQLLDGELASDDAQVLATELKSNPARRSELRQHLVTWDLWSQQQAAERSAEAFTRALATRRRAEPEGESFVVEVRRRLQGGVLAPPRRERGRIMTWLQGVISGSRRGWLTAASMAALMLGALLWTLPHPMHARVTLQGEAICTACTLHETHAHYPAIRVHNGDRTTIYYVNTGRLAIMRLGDYCVAPFPVVATGAVERHDGRRTLDVADATRPPASPHDPGGERVLFPF